MWERLAARGLDPPQKRERSEQRAVRTGGEPIGIKWFVYDRHTLSERITVHYIMSGVVATPAVTQAQLDQEEDNYFDDLEAELLGEERNGIGYGGGKSKGNVGDFTDKINLSARVQNDITKSERKGDKKSSHYGRDDRATSEQVMDPRTRLILFKLLNSGYLTEIDGTYLLHASYDINTSYTYGNIIRCIQAASVPAKRQTSTMQRVKMVKSSP